MKRDFTYVDDIIEAIVRIIPSPPSSKVDRPAYKVYNLGKNSPIELDEFIAAIERALGKSAKQNLLPMQPGDVVSTYADVNELMRDFDFKPATSINCGITKFVSWYERWSSKAQVLRQPVIAPDRIYAASNAA